MISITGLQDSLAFEKQFRKQVYDFFPCFWQRQRCTRKDFGPHPHPHTPPSPLKWMKKSANNKLCWFAVYCMLWAYFHSFSILSQLLLYFLNFKHTFSYFHSFCSYVFGFNHQKSACFDSPKISPIIPVKMGQNWLNLGHFFAFWGVFCTYFWRILSIFDILSIIYGIFERCRK